MTADEGRICLVAFLLSNLPEFFAVVFFVVPISEVLDDVVLCGGFALDVHRGVIVIDYDDGTQEVSTIPDSDVVIYPWRPPELRVSPRPLAQMLREEQERAREGKASTHATNPRSKVQVKSETSPYQLSRRKRQSRDSRLREEPSRGRAGGQGSGGEAGRASRCSRTSGGGEAASLPSYSDEDAEEESEEEGWDDGERDRGKEVKGGKDRWQQQRGGKTVTGAGRRRSLPREEKQRHRQGQRKRPGGHAKRNGSAQKRPRSVRDGKSG